MISPEYCVTMARYNQWQNNGLREHIKVISEDGLNLDRGAFFGSILATLDHIMWADRLWMNRLGADVDMPAAIPDAPAGECIARDDWLRTRPKLDAQIIEWATQLEDGDMQGVVEWSSKIYAREFRNPRALAIAHMFNHQTHHRGQVHVMLTQLGLKTMDTDIVFMPED